MMELFKTFFLMGAMTLLLVWAGGMLGGQQGMVIAFLIALAMNFFSYYNSDKLVLHHYDAVEVSRAEASGLYAIVERLSHKGEVPMPKVYIIPPRMPPWR